MWVTVTGHAACTYEKILNNDYILQSRSVSLHNIWGSILVLCKLIVIILLYLFFGNRENFNKTYTTNDSVARKQKMLQLVLQ